jgi:hypothetical protein
MLAVALFSAAYLQMPLNELLEIALYFPAMMFHEPVFTVTLVVADVALFALVMIAKTSQFRSILRCYVYAGIGYAIGIYLISNGNNHSLFVPFYGPLIGWTVAVVQNHFRPKVWWHLVDRMRRPKTKPVNP